MKALIVFGALILAATAAPDGYYKQEYQFKKSSSTYKNNQLETKNDDEGYYGKHGDLSGNTAPVVNQHNQHSEFISPSVDNVGHSLTTYNDRDLTSDAERAFRDHNILPGSNRHYSQSSYSTQSNLGQLTQNLQYDMEQQLRDAIKNMQRQSSYGSTQMRSDDMQFLENQLRNNITRQLQQSLHNQYGAQTTRGQSSYSTNAAGGYNTVANYDTNELAQLRQQMERELMKKLHESARSTNAQSSSSSSSWSSYGSSNTGYGHTDSAEIDDLNRHGHRVHHGQQYVPTSSSYRPVSGTNDYQRPERLSYDQQPSSGSQTSIGSSYGSQSRYHTASYDRDFPTLSQSQITVNPTRRVTDVLQNVQSDLQKQLSEALNAHQAKYSSSSYTLTNSRPDYQAALDDFKRQLRYNLTRMVDDELDRNYGRQNIRGDYSFSQNQRNNANYKTADLEDLKQQVENNLINFLETSFRSHESHYQQARAQQSTAHRDYTHQGPQYTQSLTSDTAQNPSYVRYEPNRSWSSSSSWSSQSSWGSGADAHGNTQQPVNDQLDQIRSQLQQDLQRQIQSAVREQKSQSSYSTMSNSQVEQLLSNELRSNLTRRLEETLNQHYGKQGVRGGQSYTISASGVYNPTANYRTEDINQLRQQLQDDLVRNLQEQLRTQSQYSATSGSYSSGPFGHDTEGQVADDMGQQTIDEFDQYEDDLVQKTIDDIEKIQVDSQTNPIRGDIGQAQNKTQVGEQGPKYEDDFGDNRAYYGNLQIGSQTKPVTVGQPTEEMGQQVEDLVNIESDENFQKPMADDEFGQFELGSNTKPSHLRDNNMRQQTEDLHTLNNNDYHQKSIDDDKFTQIERGDSGNNGSLTRNQYKPNKYLGQQTEELGQQTEDLEQTEDLGQQSAVIHPGQEPTDYVDDIILGVKPLVQHRTTSTTQHPSTTPYVTYGVYRNRHYPKRYNSETYIQPTSTGTTSTTEKMTVFNQQDEIDRFAQQIAEARGTQDGFDSDFIEHGDYLQHKPQTFVNDFRVSDSELTQQQQQENFDIFIDTPEEDMPTLPAMSLSDVHRAYISQDQYGAGPRAQDFNPYQTSQSRRLPTGQDQFVQRPTPQLQEPQQSRQIPTYNHRPSNINTERSYQHPVYDDAQHPVKPVYEPALYISSHQQRGRTYNSYAPPSQVSQRQGLTENIGQEQETVDNVSPKAETQTDVGEKDTSSEGVEEEEAVTEVVKPLGFWAKVGGKISSGYNTVKQKAKKLVGST